MQRPDGQGASLREAAIAQRKGTGLAVRSRKTQLGWIVVFIGPLALAWIASHPQTLSFASTPKQAPERVRGQDTSSKAPSPSRPRELVSLSGEVVDRDGRPVPDVPVTLIDSEERADALVSSRNAEVRKGETRTDREGRFRFGNLVPGRRQLIARPPGRAPAWTEPFLLKQGTRQVLILPLPVSVTGLTQPRAKLSFISRIPGFPVTAHNAVSSLSTADEGGIYDAEGLPPSVLFTVHVDAPGYRGRTFGPYQLPSGRYILDFDLQSGLTLRGTVRDGSGRPVAGARVVFDDARTFTGVDGSFSLLGLDEHNATLVVSQDGYIQTLLHEVRPGSVEVTLPRAAEATGHMIGGRGR
jgi:protocatechuate 3,4-dioxygenase beta subunit